MTKPEIHSSVLELLTERERSVLQLVLEGYFNKEIATQLGISVRTAEFYRLCCTRYLRARNSVELYIAATTGIPGRAPAKTGRYTEVRGVSLVQEPAST